MLALSKVLKIIQENSEGITNTPVNPELLKFTGKFDIPEKVYGREEEMTTLMDEVDAVMQKRKTKSINFVGGISGMGKSHMIMQVRPLPSFLLIPPP